MLERDAEHFLWPQRAMRRVLISFAAFALVFAGLSLPAPRLGRAVVQAACAFANARLSRPAAVRDIEFSCESMKPRARTSDATVDRAWTAVLRAERWPMRAHARIALDLRRTLWLPLALFLALVIASPIWHGLRGPFVLVIGTLALQVPLMLAALTHTVALLYDDYVVDLSGYALGAVRFGSALVAAPGMFDAIALVVWAALIYTTRARATRDGSPRNSARAPMRISVTRT